MKEYKGLDIYNQNTVKDWDKVKKENDFLILKCSQGHSLVSDKFMFKDVKLDEYAKQCINRKIPFSVYHFFTASTEQDQVQEADFCYECIKDYIDYIQYVFCDAENYNNKYLNSLSRQQLTKNINAFCDRIEELHFHQAHYTNPDHIKRYINLEDIPYPVWVACYGDNKPDVPNMIVWQHNGDQPYSGISGNVDYNIGYFKPEQFRKDFVHYHTIELNSLKYRMNANGQVQAVQQLLNGYGYTDSKGRKLNVDGQFNTYTKEQVEQFQRKNELQITGEVDEQTWNKLLKGAIILSSTTQNVVVNM